MATTKRKAVTDERPNKKVKPTDASEKQAKATKPTKPAKPQAEVSSERKAVPKSVLQQEDRAFPRGGGSVLTPIEQKQIKVQAERDVLFEQQTGKPTADENGDGELFDEGASAAAKKKQKRKKAGDEDVKQVSTLKVQGLSYKNLSIGSVLLGYVTAVTSRDVELALANNLSGYVPITAVSENLNARIERLLETDGQAEEEDDDEDIDMKDLFYAGQWLRATVTATTSAPTESSGTSKRHIELSVDPRKVNGGLDSSSVVQNSLIQASVRSVEDHGLVMELGLSSPKLSGFISKKDLGTAYELEDVEEGQVMLCLVTGKGSNGNVLNLSPGAVPRSAIAEGKQAPAVSEAPTVEGFQPGTAVDVLVTDNSPAGVAGKVMGMLDVTADLAHCGAGLSGDDINKKYKVGSKVRGRIIWALPQDDGSRRVGVSLLDHVLTMPAPPSKLPSNASAKLKAQSTSLQQHHPLSSIVEDAKVIHVTPNRGLYMQLSFSRTKEPAKAFAHISQISDDRIDTLTSSIGKYKVDSTHSARIIAYSPIDNLYRVALKPSILEQQFLRIEDLKVGENVKGKVERLILGAKGVTGVLVKLSDGVTGLVPEIHLSDTHLEHPERKFKEGFPVKARVLSVDLEKRHVRLTLKKSLVNDDSSASIWKEYASLKPGMEGKGTVVNILQAGAAVQFFGNVRAWLPVAEMSETFIERPEKHLRLGQTVNVRILSVDPEAQQMKVSCKDPAEFDAALEEAWESTAGGQTVSGRVTEKSPESVTVELPSGLKGTIRVGHLSDSATADPEKALKKVHIEKTLAELVVLHRLERSRHVLLTRKSSMVKEAKAGDLITSFADAVVGKKVHGFVRNVTPEGVYTEFAGGIVGLLPKSQLVPEMLGQAAFGLVKDQSINVWVSNVDATRERISLSMREPAPSIEENKEHVPAALEIVNPADPTVRSLVDLSLGRITKARVTGIKASQINVRLADKIQGRVDVSEAFDSWDGIRNKKAPIQKFKANDIIDVKILGVHDARNHRFLPITHRQSGVPVFELSAKKSRIQNRDESGLTMDSIKQGSQHIAFVNNHGDRCVWVNLSPNVRGRVALMDLSDDAGQLQNLEKNFPIGCALEVTVKSVDAANNKLDLIAKVRSSAEELTLETISPGMILAGRITRVNERSVTVQLSDNLGAPVPLVEIGDDYDDLKLAQYNKNDIVRVGIIDVDAPNKRLYLTLRPSKMLSSSLPVKDPQVTSYSQLKPGQLVRGFVKYVAEKGVYVSLGAKIDALVRISDLSDQYIKDWKSIVEVDQLVQGRLLSVDADAKHALLSLKASHVDENFKPPVTMTDLTPGMIVTGKVRKVEDFGAFIDIDNTQPRLSGLCHRSEVAAKRVEDVRNLYSAGDVVKAKVLAVDVEARKISLGLKASYFANGEDDVEMEDNEDDYSGVEVDGIALRDESEDEDVDMDIDGGIELEDVEDAESGEDASESDEEMDEDEPKPTGGLKTNGFDWNGGNGAATAAEAASDSEADAAPKKRKRNKPEIKVDMTGDLDKYGSRSVSDFERQLLGQPNDSGLWIQYMAFQLELSEVQRAREIAERALRTIHIRELDEKANVWIAWMNLEVEYGDEERVEDVFKQACQVQDPLEMHQKLASIYIDSGKHDKADAVFEKIVGNKAFRASQDVWVNYASFLMDSLKSPDKARSLLDRALQSISLPNEQRSLTSRFAALEFKAANGNAERGRTMFEALLSEWPKWSSGWDTFVDLERSRLSHATTAEAKSDAKEKVRALHERIASQKMKKRRARFVFKRWMQFEEEEGTAKTAERVKALEKAYEEAQQAMDGE
ncbi:rRNA biogenesis protein rrp5 [Saxophila tyrrhenica]|uniref:rRNA biogenesis protein RRP5 n=1 Tax=Saxophila tyrrhenica TaxID=1690608 RepID=A0AAV9P5C1_9PEZI|nr:rRNA biogenesis protein rrp5 [Saxophila tyrrhenica]